MRHNLEFSEGWSAEDGMVCHVEIINQEVDIVSAEVLGGAELYW
jgi:hypothetical protein